MRTGPSAAALLLLAACSGPPGELSGLPPCQDLRRAGPAPTSLVILMSDTLRRDRLGAYGGPARTPAFDAFAEANLLFENAFTQSPWTKPSIATLFTSLHPSQHGLARHPLWQPGTRAEGGLVEADVLGPGFTTLAEVLRAQGWTTAAFVSNPWLQARFGFDQGFETYDDSFAAFDAPGTLVSDRGLAWLAERQPGERYFLYLHYMDAHQPYAALSRAEIEAHADSLRAAEPPASEAVARRLAELVTLEEGASVHAAGVPLSRRLLELAYDKGVERFDAALARFLEGFDARPEAQRTAIVVTSDHGEALFERGYGNHGRGLFDDEVAIPLAARLPGVAPASGRVGCATGLIDWLPTLCVYLGVDCPEPVFGASLLGADGAADERWLVTEGVGGQPQHRAVRNQRFKLMWEPGAGPDGRPGRDEPYSLYEVATDPAERHDLLAPEARSERAQRVFEALRPQLHEAVPPYDPPASESTPIDEELADRLRALGYGD